MSAPNLLLSNQKYMPMIGLGTWRSSPNEVNKAVKYAIDVGYRHFDCAHVYGNESEVGAALEEKINNGVVTRDNLFITSKLWNTHHQPNLVRRACEITLSNLRMNYLDLYLMQWPMAYKSGDDLYPTCPETGSLIFDDVDYMDTWKAMETLVDDGLCRAIGISNFNEQQMIRLMFEARIKPVMLQIECHPYLRQKELLMFCFENDIAITAYSSLGSAHSPYEKPGAYPLLKHPVIIDIAKKYDRQPAQILLRYQTQSGIIVIPRSVTKEHIYANYNIWDFGLTVNDIESIESLDFNGRFMTMKAAYGHPQHPFENETEKKALL